MVIDDIRKAGKERKLLRIVYKKLDGEVTNRVVEPYSIRQGTRFFAYDVDKDDGIRQFIITGILSTKIQEETYEPRWEVEF